MNNNMILPDGSNLSWQSTLKLDASRFSYLIQDSSDRALLSIMGILNGLAFHLSAKFGAFTKTENKYEIVQSGVNALIEAAQSGLAEIPLATTWLHQYLAKYWRGANNSLPTLRKIRELLANVFGLFSYTKGSLCAKRSERTPPVLQQINLFRLLLIYEMCENELTDRGMELTGIGDWFGGVHYGNFMCLLYNAVFGGVQYRRESLDPNPQPVPVNAELIEAIATVDEIEADGDRPQIEVLQKCWNFPSLRDRIVELVTYFSDWGIDTNTLRENERPDLFLRMQ